MIQKMRYWHESGLDFVDFCVEIELKRAHEGLIKLYCIFPNKESS